MLITIIGPDGSGKTTIAKELIQKLNQKKIKAVHSEMHFKILPKLKDLINPFLKNKIDHKHIEGEFHAGMKINPSSSIKGSIYVMWYALDYLLGRYKIYKIKKNREIIVFARYYYDYYYQRGHLNTPHIIVKIFEILIPKPDFIFTISRPAEDIFKLKPELSVEEIKRQQKKIKQLLMNKKNAFVIDGAEGVEKTVIKILDIIKNEYPHSLL